MLYKYRGFHTALAVNPSGLLEIFTVFKLKEGSNKKYCSKTILSLIPEICVRRCPTQN